MVSKRRLGGRGNIAHLLTNRVHFACFARVQSFGWDSRKSPDASDYRCLWIGIRKTPYGVRIPVATASCYYSMSPSGCSQRVEQISPAAQASFSGVEKLRRCSFDNLRGT
jgi:hypothetical protein